MDLSLSETQELLKNTARDFLERECPWTKVRELVEKSETGFDPELWKQVVELGWTAMIIPEQYDGIGGSFTDLGVLYEEMGRALLPSPHFSTSVIGVLAVLEAGTEQQKAWLLPRIANGDLMLSFALTEPDYGWDANAIQLRATSGNGGYTLNGTKLFVPDVQVADRILCAARTSEGQGEDGITLFFVDRESPGISVRDVEGFFGAKENEVVFDSVTVPAENVLGEVGKGWDVLSPVLDKATIVLCAYMVGGGQRVIEMGIDYANNRVQFGTPIGTFPRVQDHVINSVNAMDGARWTTYQALWKIDSGQPFEVAASVAKAASSEAYHSTCNNIHEVHAAIGTTRDMPLYLYTMTARTLYHYLGDPIHHRRRIGRLLGM